MDEKKTTPPMIADTYIEEKIVMAADSDVGTVREQNEDFYFYSKPKKFFVVCDGMGGHRKGALASQLAAETVRDVMLANDTLRALVIQNKFFEIGKACQDLKEEMPAVQKLIAGIRLANRRILLQAAHDSEARGMGTTVSAILFHEGYIIIAHVGDSRVYRLRDGLLSCLTRDHSWLNELIEDKEIAEEEIKNFQKKNVLTRALGLSATLKIDLLIETLQSDDLYLVCSDGLYNALNENQIQYELGLFHGSLQNKISSLIRSAKKIDGSDNITGGLAYINSGSQMAADYVTKKHTIKDEPPEVTVYLDQSVKTIYQTTIENKKFHRKKTVVLALAVLIFMVVFLLYRATIA